MPFVQAITILPVVPRAEPWHYGRNSATRPPTQPASQPASEPATHSLTHTITHSHSRSHPPTHTHTSPLTHSHTPSVSRLSLLCLLSALVFLLSVCLSVPVSLSPSLSLSRSLCVPPSLSLSLSLSLCLWGPWGPLELILCLQRFVAPHRFIDSSIHRIIEALILGSSGVVVEAKISVLGSAFIFLYSLP